MRLSKLEWGLGAVVLVAVITIFLYLRPSGGPGDGTSGGETDGPQVTASQGRMGAGTNALASVEQAGTKKPKKRGFFSRKEKKADATVAQPPPPPTPEQLAAIKAVEDWEGLVDKLTEQKGAPTQESVAEVKEAFDKLDKRDQNDAIHRALNLLPDEQFPSLYGILFDKSENAEILDAIFSDALNRDEDIKVPLMKTLVVDKEHPMFFESARILDVTGELEKMSGDGEAEKEDGAAEEMAEDEAPAKP